MAAKIKDGLFIGDAETSQSEVFINDNKISNLVNLSAKEVHNAWAAHGLVYLSYNWDDRPDYKLFSGHDDPLLTDIVEFVDVSISHGISVLLFSRNGTGRCVVAACVYLMMKYRWGFEKTYDYVYSKKPDIDLNKGFIQQMFALDMKLLAARQKMRAVQLGIENTFKIEANMTINDISAMLPPMEAQRWNSWNTEYLDVARAEAEADSTQNNAKYESKTEYKQHRGGGSSSSSHNRGNRLLVTGNGIDAQAPEDLEEETVLLCSYSNSKNTISSLPGPYPLAMDVPKNFKLKFNRQRLTLEEDIHMFPTEPPDVRSFPAPRGVLKGSRANHKRRMEAEAAAAAQAAKEQAALDAAAAPKITPASSLSNRDRKEHGHLGSKGTPAAPAQTQSSIRSSIDMGNHSFRSSSQQSVDEESQHPHHINNSKTQIAASTAEPSYGTRSSESEVLYSGRGSSSNGGGSSARSSSSNTKQQISSRPGSASGGGNSGGSDLYGFVGMDPHLAGVNGGGSVDSRRGRTLDSAADPKQHEEEEEDVSSSRGGTVRAANTDNTRRQQQRQQSSTSSLSSSQPLGPTAEERLRVVMADVQRKNLLTREEASAADNRGGGAAPSLYDLAHMQQTNPAPAAVSTEPSGGGKSGPRRSGNSGGGTGSYMFSMEDDDDIDNLLPIHNRSSGVTPGTHGPNSNGGGGYNDSSSFDDFMQQQKKLLMQSNSRSSGGGGVRARHDIVLGGRPASARANLGGDSSYPAAAQQQHQRQYAWGEQGSGNGGTAGSRPASPSQQRPASPSARNSNRSMSSNLSVSSLNSNGSSRPGGSAVGSGAGSGQRVYRHGSPAPNNNTRSSPSSGQRISSSSSSSGRSSGLGVTGTGASRNSTSSSSSSAQQQPAALSSYSLAMAIQQQQQQQTR